MNEWMNEEPSMNAANRVPSQPNLHPAHTSLMYFVDARNVLRLHYHFRSFLGLISILLFWLKLMKHWCHCANIVSNEETISYFCTSVWFGFLCAPFLLFPSISAYIPEHDISLWTIANDFISNANISNANILFTTLVVLLFAFTLTLSLAVFALTMEFRCLIEINNIEFRNGPALFPSSSSADMIIL